MTIIVKKRIKRPNFRLNKVEKGADNQKALAEVNIVKEKSKEELYRLILSATFLSALPDSEKQVLWEKAKKENPEYPILSYFDNITEGFSIVCGLFEKIRHDLL